MTGWPGTGAPPDGTGAVSSAGGRGRDETGDGAAGGGHDPLIRLVEVLFRGFCLPRLCFPMLRSPTTGLSSTARTPLALTSTPRTSTPCLRTSFIRLAGE